MEPAGAVFNNLNINEAQMRKKFEASKFTILRQTSTFVNFAENFGYGIFCDNFGKN